MAIREFVENDIPKVAKLYWEHLSAGTGEARPELQNAFANLYFSSPWAAPETPSFVYDDNNGETFGFLGIITRKMRFEGETVRVGFGGNFVVHPKARGSRAASRLIQAMLSGNQDMFLSDSANEISRRLVERVGFQLVPSLSMHWSRPIQPSRYILRALFRGRSRGGAVLRTLGRPFVRVVDRLLTTRWNPLSPLSSVLQCEELSAETLLHCFCTFSRNTELQPTYDAASLRWLLKFMERNRKRGNLRKTLLRDENQNIVGWYIYYVNVGAIGEVVQLGAAKKATANVIGALLRDSRDSGTVALHGLAEFEKMADYSGAGCFFNCRGGWTLAYSRRAELIDVFLRGKGTLSRLDGEWCLHPGC